MELKVTYVVAFPSFKGGDQNKQINRGLNDKIF